MNTRIDRKEFYPKITEEEWVRWLIETCVWIGWDDPMKKCAELIVGARTVAGDEEVDYSEEGEATHDCGWDVPTRIEKVIAQEGGV